MASIVSICNLALSNVGKDNISDIDESSAEARACKQFYAQTVESMLQVFPWSFAREMQALAEVENSRPNRWAYAYRRPVECLAIRYVTDALDLSYLPRDGDPLYGGGLPYEYEGTNIFCSFAPAYLVFTRWLEDTTRFPPLFVDALSWQLAVRLAMPLTRDPKVRADAYQLAVKMQAQAAVADANETPNTSDYVSEAIEARS